MKKIVVFPYHPDVNTLIDFKSMLKCVTLSGFISFKEDKHLIQPLNKAIGSDNLSAEKLLENCDAVVLVDNFRGYNPDKYYQLIEYATCIGKEILITPLAESQLELSKWHGRYHLLEHLPSEPLNSNSGDASDALDVGVESREIDIPVITVAGMGKNCDKFMNQLLLKELLDKEYTSVSITSNALGALFGCYTIPSFLYENQSFYNKVTNFNRYVYKVTKEQNADVITIGIPEGVLEFGELEQNHFTEYPLVVTTAVAADLTILCTYFMRNEEPVHLERKLSEVMTICENKFDMPIDAIAISRTNLEIPTDEFVVRYEYLDEKFLQKYYPTLEAVNLPLIDITNRSKAFSVLAECILRLEDNADAI